MDEKDKQTFKDLRFMHEIVELNFDFSRVPDVEFKMHKQRGELLGIIDRLLASTPHNETMLKRHQAFGAVSSWFGGHDALTLAEGAERNVFVKYHGVQWTVLALMQHADANVARVKELTTELEGENGLRQRNDRQAETIKEQRAENERLRRGNGALAGDLVSGQRKVNGLLATLDERNQTIQRKDALLIEKDKEIKQLKVRVMQAAQMPGDVIPYNNLGAYRVEIEPPTFGINWGMTGVKHTPGRVANLADLVNEAGKVAADNDKLKSALRSTQEELGETRVELADALEEIENLDERLEKIVDVAEGGQDDEPESEGEAVGDFGTIIVDIGIPGAWGTMTGRFASNTKE